MDYVREKTRASNFHVRESNVRYNTRDSEFERKRHIGNRWGYNGKHLGTNYTGGKRNSAVSFMFFNFPNGWGMGNLWMLFKKFGTVFDMYMAQKRLRKGERYGFVRFKLVTDVEALLKKLGEITIGGERLKVFIAFDRKIPGVTDMGGNRNVGDRKLGENRNYGNEMRKEKVWSNNGWNGDTRDHRNFVEVVKGETKDKEKKGWNGEDGKDGDRKYDGKNEYMEEKQEVRTVEVEDDEVNIMTFNKSLIGEVRSLCYITKIASLCEEQGLSNVEVKLLGGLEVMMVFDTQETATNILGSVDHGLRRWVHKLRRWSKHYITPGRLTWISILGIPVSCWAESVFKKVAAIHGRVIGNVNCKLEGSQNLIVGKVQIHTCNNGLIKETLFVKVFGRKFRVEVIEEVGDIMEFELDVMASESKDENEKDAEQHHEKGGDNDMVISDSETSDDTSEEGSESEGEENEDERDTGNDFRPEDGGGRKMEEGEESRFSGTSKVCETPENEIVKKEKKAAVEFDKAPGEDAMEVNEKNNEEKVGVESDKVPGEYVMEVKEKNIENQDATTLSGDQNIKIRCESCIYQKSDNGPNGYISCENQNEECVNKIGPEVGLQNGVRSCNTIKDKPIQHEINTSGQKMGYNNNNVGTVDEFGKSRRKILKQRKDVGTTKQSATSSDEELRARGTKRGFQPTAPICGGDEKINKKRKANREDKEEEVSNSNVNMNEINNVDFGVINKSKVFKEGVDGGAQISNKKGGRKSLKKALKLARQHGVGGLGTNEKGVSDAYKISQNEENDGNETFVFRSTGRAVSESKSCSINMEQVKEIGELIGVSWTKAKEEIVGGEDMGVTIEDKGKGQL
ncbi:Transposon TX1 [Artemisia annua]|uniref:Transposon TX1 n=1 Tax=Artemisia annua TaxID=35608 RepID=A0A2U1L451_ARTAN|nr:Transposon TX1 [Artemisia annua]